MTDPRAHDGADGAKHTTHTDFALSDEDDWTEEEIEAYHAEAGTLFDDPEEYDDE